MRMLLILFTVGIASFALTPLAFAEKPSWLKCDPVSLKYKPTIILSGDVHDLPAVPTTVGTDAAPYVKEMNARIREAAEGKYYLGLEGLYLRNPDQWRRRVKLKNWNKSKVFGYEDPFPGGLTLLMKVFSEVSGNRAYAKANNVDRTDGIERAKADFLVFMSDNISLQEVWKDARSKNPVISVQKDEDIGKVFDQIVANPRVNTNEIIKSLPKTHGWHDDMAFLDTIRGFAKGYGGIAMLPEFKKRYGTPENLPVLVDKFFSLNPTSTDVNQAMTTVAVTWRNPFIASGILYEFCEAASQSKDIRVIIGMDHVNGLKALIQDALGPTISVQSLDPAGKALEGLPKSK